MSDPTTTTGRKTGPLRRPGHPAPTTPIPVAGLSIYDPVYLGPDENGVSVLVSLMYRNMLIAGEPGGGKSVAINNIVGHAALCAEVRLVLIDGKLVEMLPWAAVADEFVGHDPDQAIDCLTRLQTEMDTRYRHLATHGLRKITRADGMEPVILVIDELAYFSVTVGDRRTQEQFVTLVRDLVARGRAAGIIVIAATQRPSADIIPTSLRDLFGYRLAFRCTTDSSSDIILGVGWAKEGYSAKHIAPEDRGIGWLLAEGGTPRRLKSAYLTDDDIQTLVARAAWIRTNHHTHPGSPDNGGGEAA